MSEFKLARSVSDTVLASVKVMTMTFCHPAAFRFETYVNMRLSVVASVAPWKRSFSPQKMLIVDTAL